MADRRHHLSVHRPSRADRRAARGKGESEKVGRGLAGEPARVAGSDRAVAPGPRIGGRRIARELHDDLNQGLALLAVHLDLLGQGPPESGARLAERIREISDRVKQLSSVVHGLSTVLHPSKLEQLGLVAAVRGLCKELTQVHGLAIEFVAQPMPSPIPDDTALCLYRIAQEPLSNVIKHSGARHARVELSGNEAGVSLRIGDDGAGFEGGTPETKEGLGLVSMRERLRLVGGAIAIDSRRSAGTRIDVHVPLPAAGEEPIVSPEEARHSRASPI